MKSERFECSFLFVCVLKNRFRHLSYIDLIGVVDHSLLHYKSPKIIAWFSKNVAAQRLLNMASPLHMSSVMQWNKLANVCTYTLLIYFKLVIFSMVKLNICVKMSIAQLTQNKCCQPFVVWDSMASTLVELKKKKKRVYYCLLSKVK